MNFTVTAGIVTIVVCPCNVYDRLCCYYCIIACGFDSILLFVSIFIVALYFDSNCCVNHVFLVTVNHFICIITITIY